MNLKLDDDLKVTNKFNLLQINFVYLIIFLYNLFLNHMRQSPPKLALLLLLSLSLFIVELNAFSYSNMYSIESNVNQITDYYISFTPTQAYDSNVNIQIDFPLQYDLAQISSSLQCYLSRTGKPNSYSKVQCGIQPNLDSTKFYTIGAVVVYINSIDTIQPINIVLRNVQNPSSQSSSFFSVCLRKFNYLLECEKQFQRLLFTPTYNTYINGTAIGTTPMTAVVCQGNTYQFTMNTNIINLASTFNLNTENMMIRVVFPQRFNSTTPVCSLVKYSISGGSLSQAFLQQNTTVTPSRTYSVECNNLFNLTNFIDTSGINDVITLKIQNMYNPLWSGSYNGIYIQICRSNHHQIIETIQFSQIITIVPEQLTANVRQTNLMRNSTNQYFFTISHDLFLDNTSQILITIGNNTMWNLISARLLDGFTNPQTLNFTISQIAGSQSTVKLFNYGNASNQVDQIIAINLTSPDIIGTQSVNIKTLINGQVSGVWNGQVQLNSTWGSFNLLSFSAVEPAVKLPVAKTGPLQLTFFLNYELPPSQSIQNGTMKLSFTPPIPTPDPNIYGVVKCYWKGTLQSANCTYDNSDPTKTLVTMLSPPYDYFQYSQIPIIITTQGGIDIDHLGLTIDPMVQRYRFSCQFYLYNSSIIPSQVYYTTWIADAIQLLTVTTVTAHSLTYECQEWTSIQINLTSPILNLPSLTVDQRIIVQFLPDGQASAWQANLGYQPNTIYKQYPCVMTGLPGTKIQCDLYTYSSIVGPYNKFHINSYFFGPFIMIYGFDSFPATGLNVIIQLPRIQLSNIPEINAIISVSIVGQTPGETQPYIEYYHQNLTVFQTLPPISLTPATIASSMGSVQVQTMNQYVLTWNPLHLASIQYIKYDFKTNKLPSLITQSGACTSNCYSAGYPANWIVQNINPSSPHTLTTLASFITSMNQIPSLTAQYPISITTYDINGNTLDKYKMDITYIPQPITSSAFILLDSAGIIYSGLKQWYEIDFTTTNALTSTYPYIRFILSNQMKFSSPPQCNSTSITAFNQSGIQCQIADTNGHQLLIWNINQLLPLTSYEMNVRLQTILGQHSSPISPFVQIQVCYNYTILDSFVSYQPNQPLGTVQTPQMSKPAQFTINNPQILDEQIRVNYIGRVFFDFDSTAALTTDLKIYFGDHRYNTGFWSTPNLLNTDPVVCMLNNIRFHCNPTNSPLTIYISSAQITAGRNRLQIDTQYIAPYNGIRFPSFAGHFPITISAVASGVQTIKNTFFVYVHPSELLHLQVGSIVKDINTQSVFLVNFTIDSTIGYPTANHDPTIFSRIFIQFPTLVNGQTVFQNNLGGYQGDMNERVGCSFMLNAPYIAAQALSLLECRLIPPPSTGDPCTVQIINFDTFSPSLTSVAIWIYKVFTPTIAYNSVDIKVKINQYTTTGAQIYPLFESKYTVFLDSQLQNTSPIQYASVDNPTTTFFESGQDVGNYGTITMNAHLVGSATLTNPFYMLVKLPKYLPVQNQQIATAFSMACPSSSFQYCLTAPDVNYVLVKVLVNQSIFTFYISNYPISISLQDSYYDSMIINAGRYLGNIQYDISPTRWLAIQGVITHNYQEAVGLTQKTTLGKQKFYFQISFSVANYIPPEGTIQIGFPSSVTKIYPGCRSVASNGSFLLSASGASGQIGCSVQSGNKWTITGFAQVIGPFPLTVVISGFIDLPLVGGQLGMGHVTTYANNDPIDIFTNGSRIDHLDFQYNLTVQSILAMNPNQNVFLSQRNPVRAGDIGQFRFMLITNTQITSTGYITVDFYKKDIFGNAGGFMLNGNAKVCEIIDISTQTRIGCIVISQTSMLTGSANYIQTIIQPSQNLQASLQYQVRITTQTYSYPGAPQGINYPTLPSTYKIDVSMQEISSSPAKTQHLYLQVYGTPFSQLTVTQYNYLQGQFNLYWFQLSPTTTISISHRIVIQFPTMSNDMTTRLFANDLGLYQYPNGCQIAYDIFDSAPFDNNFMQCNIFHGDYTRAIPVKIVCGSFASAITNGQILRFALGVNNPVISNTQYSIPLLVYSQDSYFSHKTNFNLVNGAGYIFDKPYIISPTGYFATTSMQREMPTDNLLLGDAHSYPLLVGDAFLIKFNFPIRVNGKFVGGCMNSAQTLVYGDVYYHERNRVIICKVTTNPVPTQISPGAYTMLINNFYTPWYLLSNGWERQVYGVAHYYSLTLSQVITYQDPFPLLPARYVFPTPPAVAIQSILTKQPVIGHMTICQRDDYVFTAIIDNTATGATAFNLQYTNLVGIFFPLNTVVDYNFFNTDCIQHTSSQIQVISCYIDFVARAIYIEIQPGVYSNNKIIAVQTKGLAIQNPCTLWSADLMSLFTVSYFSWTNITASNQKSSNIIYMSINSLNMAPFPYTYTYQLSNGAVSTYYTPFDWVQVPYQRYFNQFPQYKAGQYSPFKFDLYLPVALSLQSPGNYHTLTLYYGNSYTSLPQQTANDLHYYKPVCYIQNTRVQLCVNDDVNKLIYMKFEFALPAGNSVTPPNGVNVYFSIQDPRNTDVNGFQYTSSSTDVSSVYLELLAYGNPTPYLFNPNPFQAKQTNINPPTATLPQRVITSTTIDYSTAVAGQLNLIDISLTLSRTDISGVVLQIPLVDQSGSQIYGSNYLTAFFGLNDGDEYPCSNNGVGVTAKAKCILYNGQNTNLGISTKIMMTDFTYSGNILHIRILLYNPVDIGKWFSIYTKIYSGAPTNPTNSLFGHQYRGYWRFFNLFQTVTTAGGNYYSNSITNFGASYVYPSTGLWRSSTTMYVAANVPYYGVFPGAQYIIFQILLSNYAAATSDDQYCFAQWTLGDTSSDDMLTLRHRQSQYDKAFFVKKVSAFPWAVNYVKCKHYVNPFIVYYNIAKTMLYQISHTISFSSFDTSTYFGTTLVDYFAVSDTRTFVEIDLTSSLNYVISQGFVWQNNINYYLYISISGMYFPSFTSCQVAGGFLNTMGGMPTCTGSTTYLIITNFQKIIYNTRLAKYAIKIDVQCTYTSAYSWNYNYVYPYLYANVDSYSNGQWIFYSTTFYFLRQYPYWNTGGLTSNLNPCSGLYSSWYAPSVYNEYFQSKNLVVTLSQMALTTTTLTLSFTLQPTVNMAVMTTGYTGFFYFGFWVEGITFTCSTINSFSATYFNGATNWGSNLAGGFRCSSPATNYFQYSSQLNGGQSWGSVWGNAGNSFLTTHSIQFTIVVNVVGVPQVSTYREWMSLKVSFYQISFSSFSSCWSACCGSCYCAYYPRSYAALGYGDNYAPRKSLFSSASFGALSNIINKPTQIILTMNLAQIPFGAASQAQSLLIQLNTGSTTLFPYVNSTGTNKNQQIECTCIKSNFSNFGSSSSYSPNCILRFPQGTIIYTAISVDLDVLTNQYVQCYFPGFVTTSSTTYSFNAKLVNKDSSYPIYVGNDGEYGGNYITGSSSLTFSTNTPTNILTVTQTPSLYNASTAYINTINSAYTLTASASSTLISPILYVDFQKGGPIPTATMCSNLAVYQNCRVYNTYRNILVVQFVSNANLMSFYLATVSLPKQKQKDTGSDFNLNVYAMQSGQSYYTYQGTMSRTSSNLLPTAPTLNIYADEIVGNNVNTLTSPILISFTLSGQTIMPMYLKNNAQMIITYDQPIVLANRGCTVTTAAVSDSQGFFFCCSINAATKTITIANKYFNKGSFTASGVIQVVIGVKNINVNTNFRLQLYSYFYDVNTYGLLIDTSGVYTPWQTTGLAPTTRSQTRMYPFNTKVYSNVMAPYRMGFKLSSASPSLVYTNPTVNYFILDVFDALSAFTLFQCIIKQYSTEPTTNLQSPQPNSYRNYRHNTQYIPLYTYCTLINPTALNIEIPRFRTLDSTKYYELIVMPVTATSTGFANALDLQYKFISWPNSNEYIGSLYTYIINQITFTSMYVVATRPQTPTAIQLMFTLASGSALIFPNHYFEIVFKDLTLAAIVPPYNILGETIPCTLSSAFSVTASRISTPNCIVNYNNYLHQIITIRVQNFGNLAAGGYSLSLDYFLLPDLSSLLQRSQSFNVWMIFHSTLTHYQKYIGQIFLIDGYTNNVSCTYLTTATFFDAPDLRYGQQVSPHIQISYPMTSSGTIDQKIMLQLFGGYSSTTSPILFAGTIWYNPMLKLYIIQQTAQTLGSLYNFTLSNVYNPMPYQKEAYENSNIYDVSITLYNGYMPNTNYIVNQTPYPSFIPNTPLVKIGTSFSDDIKISIPFNTLAIFQTSLTILQNYANINKYQQIRLDILFTSNVNQILKCLVNTVDGVQYSSMTICTTTSPTSITLYNFDTSNTNHNLTLYVWMKTNTNAAISYTSNLYCSNGQLQYTSSTSYTFTTITATANTFNFLSFTQNHYTPNYYESIIRPMTQSSIPNKLYFSLFIPSALLQTNSVFTIYLNASLSIAPNTPTNTLLICQWMQASQYGRAYLTGKYSICHYVAPNIVVQSPLWGLTDVDGSGNRIPYLLKIRQESIITSGFTVPSTSQVQQILLELNSNSFLQDDTLIIHPYQFFTGLNIKHYTLSTGDLDTYHIEFTPQASHCSGYQCVLQLDIDNRYMPVGLGISNIYSTYGVSSSNQTRINYLNTNIIYDQLPNQWINGIPYTCFTSTAAAPQQTCISVSNSKIKIALLLETFALGTPYFWKIPLLQNPSTANMPFRMNLTLWSYPAGATMGNKQLFYQIVNQYKTITTAPPSVSYDITASAQSANIIQTSTNDLSIKFSTYVATTNNVVAFKVLSFATGIIDFLTFQNGLQSDTSYTFYYFKRLGFMIAEKISNNGVLVVNLGPNDVSNYYSDYYGFDWLKIYSKSLIKTIYASGQVRHLLPPCSILAMDSVSILQGSGVYQNSQYLYEFVFTSSCIITANSTLKISSSVGGLVMLPDKLCQTSFRSMGCWTDGTNLYISFTDQMAAPSQLTIRTYVKSLTRISAGQISGFIFAIPNQQQTIIDNIPTMTSLSTTLTSQISNGQIFQILIIPLYQNTQRPIYGTFTPMHLLFTYVTIDHPFVGLIDSDQYLIYRFNNSLSPYQNSYETFELNWIKTIQDPTLLTTTFTHQTIPPNGINSYAIQTARQYVFKMSSTYQGADINNFLIGPVGQYYQFTYKTDSEIEYNQVYPVPVAQPVIIINPLLQVSKTTALGFQFTSLLQNILPGDQIIIQLDTNNLMQGMYTFNNEQIQCVQLLPGILTSNPSLVCNVQQYPTATVPLILVVYPTNTVAAGTQIQIWISPVINPAIIMVAGVTIKVQRPCFGQKLCTIYEGRGFYRTINSLVLNNYPVGIATFSPSITTVLQQNVIHSYTFPSTPVSAAFIKYPQNYQSIMPLTCIATGSCLIFPNQRKVVALQSSASVSSLSISGMTNGIYIQPNTNIFMTLVSSTNIDVYQVAHNNLTTLQIIPLTTNPTTFVITNTQTIGSIFLRNYWNTVKMEITGLYTNNFIKAFVINAPIQIMKWDTTYCNATIQNINSDPYPTRLDCAFINDTTIQVLIPQGVSYQPGISDTEIMTVYAKMWIVDFPTGTDILYISPPQLSGTFNALGSFSTTNLTYPYYITQAFTPITISQHHVPILGDTQFHTASYTQRLVDINQKNQFDILIDPLTTDPVDTIQIIIPQEFGYPGVQYIDICQMMTTWITDFNNCQEIRQNGQTIVKIKMTSAYDNGPRIIKLSSDNITNLFTAPSIPGDWYNMTVSLYAVNGSLLQKQTTKNCSVIGGDDFYLPNMTISNGKDNSKQQIVDISFIPGQDGIKQGYSDGLASFQVYSQIRISFENIVGFSDLLNIQNTNLIPLGCVTNLKAYKEVLCQLHQGTSVNDQPTIVITGYEAIQPYYNVKISISSIQNLANGPTQRNTLSVSVKYHQVNSSSQSFFMYNPAQLLLLATSPYSSVLPTFLSISYTGQQVVLSPSTIQIRITPTVNINSYFVLKFPKNGISNQYSRFNPVCLNCQKLDIFYRSDQIRIYPLGGVHTAGTTITYQITGFPSWQIILPFQTIQIQFEAYSNLKIVNYQLYSMSLQMTGCYYNFNVIQMSSPYSGDIGLTYNLQLQVNTSNLLSNNEITAAVVFPNNYPNFDINTVCYVSSPLKCIFQDGLTLTIQNIRQFNQSIINITLYNVTNPDIISTNIINTYLYEGSESTNQICQSNTSVNILSSPPNKCTIEVLANQQSSKMISTYTFFIICQQAIRNQSVIKISLPQQYSYNNPLANSYNCWSNYRPNLLQESCQIVYQNGTYYLQTLPINVLSNQIQLDLSFMINNPLISKVYNFTSYLLHANQVYSTTNSDSLMIYAQNNISNISSIVVDFLPKSAGSDAIYFIRIPTASIGTSMDLSFGSGYQWDSSQLAISYFQTNQTSLNSDYFDLLQKSHNNILPSSVDTTYNLNQVSSINTQAINSSSNLAWTYIILSPVTNPSYTSTTNISITTYTQPTLDYYLMKSQATIAFNFTIAPPSQNAHMIAYTVGDNDILYLTQHNLTYRLDASFYSNKSAFIITPPDNHISDLTTIEGCLYVQNILIQCNRCVIGSQQLKFNIQQDGLTIQADEQFTISLTNLYNPQIATKCDLQSATKQDYEMSYFQLSILNDNNQISHQSISQFFQSDTPCVQFVDLRGDIMTNLPDTLYSGFQYQFNVSVSIPTKSLRVNLTTNDSDLTFDPSVVYFNNYDMTYFTVNAHIQTNGINKTVQVYLNHNQSLGYDIFRPNIPILVKILSNHMETVYINQLSSESVGYQIKIPVYLSRTSIYDMYLNITPQYSNSSYSFAQYFKFSTTNLYITAYTNLTYFTFLYSGKIIPQTLNVSLSLFSPFNLQYKLNTTMIYFYFRASDKYQTLPTIMCMYLMLTYQNNSAYAGKTIYHYRDQNLNYDYLKPVILKHTNYKVGSTSAQIEVWTRNQATVYYQLLESGSQYLKSPNSTQIRLSNISNSAITVRNSTKIVNAYTIINFTSLEQQTDYVLYMSAHDAFGDSDLIYIHNFTTLVLSNAIKFSLNTYTLQTDMVNIVRILSELLEIDINRIKVVSSYKLISKDYLNGTHKNQPVYEQQIVISPSVQDDSVTAEQTFDSMLLNNAFNQQRLKQLLPSWTGNFNSSTSVNQKPFYVLNRVKPLLNVRPKATRISYYNATFSVKYWNKAHIYAIVIVQDNQTPLNDMSFVKKNISTSLMKQIQNTTKKLIPNSKQIIFGRDAYNNKLNKQYTFNGLTDQNGLASFYFKGLKPGQYCTVYVTATNPEQFQPYIYGDNGQVSFLSFNTLWNPNLKGDKHMNLDQLKAMDPKMYEVINSYYSNKDNRNFRSA